MSSLSLSLLGPFEANLDGRPLGRFRTRSVQALLVYLACQPEDAHRRESLMALLWPGLPQASAQASLRQSLYLLRKAISEVASTDGRGSVPFLSSDRQTIQINPDAAYDLDSITFSRLLRKGVEHWPEAVALYRGDFLTDFYLPDSEKFEEWTLARRQDLRRQMMDALDNLAARAIGRGDYDTGARYARRQLEIDNLREPAHRQLMEALALSGRRTEALSHYNDFRQLLQKELGVEPSADIKSLHQRIAEGEELPAAAGGHKPVVGVQLSMVSGLPPFLEDSGEFERTRPVFVGRESELKWLYEKLSLAYQGQTQVAFVIGDAGAGKSALLRAFAEYAAEEEPELLVARGTCDAFIGSGDPYLPFRDILNGLSGDVESRWSAGMLTNRQAKALWEAIPLSTSVLLEHGPRLIDTLVSSSALVARASTALPADSPLLPRLRGQAAREAGMTGDLEQSQLFEQVATVLRKISEEQPLLLLLDDFQWADNGSINLLFHLGRRLENSPMIFVCAYREEEVALGREDGKQHPMKKILDEFKRERGDIWLDLNQTQDAAFIDAYLDSESNHLDKSFRSTLSARTGGHPLFTVELLRDLQERGDLHRDEDGRWMALSTLNWDALPIRIEGVIEARIDRLDDELRDILTVAAVEGEDFTAQVIARIQQLQERQLLKTLSTQLDRRHRLIRERAERKLGSYLLSRYQFAHALFQQYLYNNLSAGERRLLHGEIAGILEELYAERLDEITVQLAWHFAEAGDGDKALPYLIQAGDGARALYAFDEAIHHYELALAIYKDQGDYESASRILMKLGLTYHSAFDYEHSGQAYEEGFRLQQQRSLTLSPTHLAPAPSALMVTTGNVLTLDPGRHNEGDTRRILGQLFSGLINLTPDMNVVPDVASSWEVLNEGQTYVFHLRDDVCWSDGEPVTAHDFVLGLRRVLDPTNHSPAASVLIDIRCAADFHKSANGDLDALGIKALDDWRLQIDLEQPCSYFLYLLDHSAAFPAPGHIIAAHGDAWTDLDHIVSNGPFQLESYDKGHLMVLRRNPTYHGRFRGNLEVVQVRIETDLINDLYQLVRSYERDEYDILTLEHLPPAERQRTIQRHATDYITRPELNTYYVSFDVSRPPFDDPRVRQAFVLTTDRQTLAAVTEMGHKTPATGGFVPLGMPGHVPGIALPFDVEQARRLLSDAGYPGGEGFPKVTALTSKVWEKNFERILDPWRSTLGVEISCESLGWSVFIKRVRDETDLPHIYSLAWGVDYPDPHNVMYPGNVSTNWQDDAYKAVVEQARRVMDHDERMRLYRKAEEILVREAPFFPVYYTREHLLVKPWIRNYRPAVIGAPAWKDVIIDPH